MKKAQEKIVGTVGRGLMQALMQCIAPRSLSSEKGFCFCPPYQSRKKMDKKKLKNACTKKITPSKVRRTLKNEETKTETNETEINDNTKTRD